MTDHHRDQPTSDRHADSDADLQKELRREEGERTRIPGDTASNRNVGGSSTWETMPVAPLVDRPSEPRSSEDEARRRVAEEIAGRLRRDGVRLDGRESDEELVTLLEVVERFEAAVQRRGGDLMVDEPVGRASPIAPDSRAFVLPTRRDHEPIAAFVERIAAAMPS